MVTLGSGQLEDRELDDWGVSWWRGSRHSVGTDVASSRT